MRARTFRKIEALSTKADHWYECNSCVWMVHVSSDRVDEVSSDFHEHNCEENSLSKPRVATSLSIMPRT